MGEPKHFLSDIDEAARIGVCAMCGPVTLKSQGVAKGGRQRWRCRKGWEEHNAVRGNRASGISNTYRRFKKERCESADCTATIEHAGQLDVHHIDENPRNNDPANLVTLCANCHRLAHLKIREARKSEKLSWRASGASGLNG